MFGQRLEVNIVKEMLDYSQELKETYTLYQALLRAMTNRDFSALACILQSRSTTFIS